MTKDEALKLALEALELHGAAYLHHELRYEEAITTAKEALAQPEQKLTGIREIRVTETVKPEQEPVAWMCTPFGDTEYEFSAHQECENCVPCYTTPPKREWVGLTNAHFVEAAQLAEAGNYLVAFQRIQQWIKELNT